ncbi:MAG: hypothetical protein SV760_00915 [Halobacteria archaeon]|nr:hypothetical protein [Halobacteria archaeon]
MQDRHRELMFRCFKDATDIVYDYNEWSEDAFGESIQISQQTVVRIATLLYQSRVAEAHAASELEYPKFDNKMFE